ncbi:MAG: hypothetical protein J6H18_05385 [Lachnospiraceae bacterium]|nr:hypothetical protein [Lachnospiraceae bacterium]
MELRRTLFSLKFLAVLGLLLAGSLAIFLYAQAQKSGNLSSYIRRYDEEVTRMASLSSQEALAIIQEYRDFAELQYFENPGWIQEEGRWEEKLIYDQLEKQVKYRDYYPRYLEKIGREAKQQQSISIFAKPGTVAYENTQKTVRDFGAMSPDGIDIGHDLAVTAVFDDQLADFAILILLGFVCALFLAERRRGLWDMIHASKNGRLRLALVRCGILFAASWIGSLVLLGGRILLSGLLYNGLGEGGRKLQAIELFYNVPYEMTVGQFWLFYLAVKALGSFMIALLLWLILSSSSQLSLAVVAAALVLGAEYGFTFLVPSSALVLLRYVNIFSFISYIRVFTTYLNLPLFGGLISGSRLVLLILLPLILLFLAGNLVIASKKYPVSRANRLLALAERLTLLREKLRHGRPLFLWECHKLLIKRLGILVLAALLIWSYRADAPYRISTNPLQEALEDYYARKYAGPVTETVLKDMEEELSTLTVPQNMVVLETLIEKAKSNSEDGWIVPVRPYEAIWSNNIGNYHCSTALMALLFLVLLLYPIETQEKQSEMEVHLRTSPRGRRALWRRKTLLCALMAFLVWLSIYGFELLHTEEVYGSLMGLQAPMGVLKDFPGWKISIGTGLAVYYGLKLLVLLSAAFVIRLLSGFMKSNRNALLLNMLVMLLPAVLVTLGVEAASSLSFLKPLGTAEVFFEPVPFVLVLAIGIAALLLTRNKRNNVSTGWCRKRCSA